MEFKGTKGECTQYTIVNEPHISWIVVKSENGDTVADFKGVHCGIPNEQMNANAKLFIAAPELLEALKNIVNQIENEHVSEYMDEFSSQAKQVINKALN